MNHIESVSDLGDGKSRWTAVGPLGAKLHWTAEITGEQPGEYIAWRSLPGSDLEVNGRVEFSRRPAIAERWCTQRCSTRWPTARRNAFGFVGRQANFFLRQDLRRFKALLETGEVPTTRGQSHGPRSAVAAAVRAMNPDRPFRGLAPHDGRIHEEGFMKAVCWMGKEKMSVENVPDPQILNPRDAIIRITRTAICGSDLHLYGGFIPTMEQGDIVGHGFMGEVVEVGPGISKDKLKVGEKVVVPFTIACGKCFFCEQQLWSCCDNSNPNYWVAEKLMGSSPSGLFGYSHMTGGYAGGQLSMHACPSLMSDRSRCRATFPTRRYFSSATSSPPDTWARRIAISSRGTPWQFGAPARWRSLRFAARSCWGPSALSRSIVSSTVSDGAGRGSGNH